ncbi:hypothetical protein VaNZ11_010044 [Volvox africanus]|uniref:Globin n=1 Tax=Volvox africanus TaxID=51714 RepID=A0ABQ5S8N0_9CHLO|nr:hypothetical protein VaNZ11_010044 [Volvox africanus]
MVYLRAKQSAFMSWLFGPPNIPYSGKNLRTAHLKLIKQRGFSPADFDLGMEYYETAMRELNAPETVINEVMGKIRPFKNIIFTPTDKDGEEEARWEFRERINEQEQLQAVQQQHGAAEQQQAGEQQSQRPNSSLPLPLQRPKSSGSIRGPQCPFTAGCASCPSTASVAASIKTDSIHAAVAKEVLAPVLPKTPGAAAKDIVWPSLPL